MADRLNTWEVLFARALALIDSVEEPAGAPLIDWSFGGGTVLMRRHHHRFSKDIDIFLSDPQWFGYLTPRLSDAAAAMTTNYVEEVIFDGKLEAQASLDASAAQIKATQAKERERLVIPANSASGDKLAAHYSNASLGNIDVKHRGKDLVFDFGEWASVVASRKNDDGTISFITIDPTVIGFEFVVSERDGKPVLVTRDAQHEYVFAAGH